MERVLQLHSGVACHDAGINAWSGVLPRLCLFAGRTIST